MSSTVEEIEEDSGAVTEKLCQKREADAPQPSAGDGRSAEKPVKRQKTEEEKYLISGPGAAEYLLSSLATAQPREFIEQLQRSRGFDATIPAFKKAQPALRLLDLLRFPRSSLYEGILSSMRARLLEKINSGLSEEATITLLEHTFPYIGFEELADVPMTLMKRCPNIPHSFLRQLVDNPDLYKRCDISIQRQVWEMDETIFRKEVFPLLNDYLTKYEDEILSPAGSNDWTAFRVQKKVSKEAEAEAESAPRLRREKNSVLQALVRLLGRSVRLYQLLLHFIRTLYVSTGTAAFCSLRNNLLMALHDHGLTELYESDQIDKFAVLLDMCLRERGKADLKKLKDMEKEMESLAYQDTEATPLVAEAAMLCADPAVSNALLRMLYDQLVDVVDRQVIPKEDEALRLLSSFFLLGISAASVMRERPIRPGLIRPDRDLLVTFFPTMAACILEAKLRDVSPLGKAAAKSTISASDSDTLSTLIKTNLLARRVTLFYLVKRLEDGDLQTVQSLLAMVDPPIAASESAFVQSFISALVTTTSPELRRVGLENAMRWREGSVYVQRQLIRYFVDAHRHHGLNQLTSLVQDLVSSSKKFFQDNPGDPLRQREKLVAAYLHLQERLQVRLSAEQLSCITEFIRNQ